MKYHEPLCYYYVDEAGDGTLFNRRGKVIIGDEGCSRYFMMGLLKVTDPQKLASTLEALRQDLLADPYFKQVPSMQSKDKKTALSFHAKDDIPEVRREVFKVLKTFEGLEFSAVVKQKLPVVSYVKTKREKDPTYRYHPNELYDYLVRRLFKDKLHKADEYQITFAKRGNASRTKALQNALQIAEDRSNKSKSSISGHSLMKIQTLNAVEHSGLQAVDYFLWALQRVYERREDRYLEYLWSSIKLIVDIDDKREANYGKYYTQRNRLSIDSLPTT
jgi:hypothetical protein